jgi:hypothetical protein
LRRRIAGPFLAANRRIVGPYPFNIVAAGEYKASMFRIPDALQYEVVLRRAGTIANAAFPPSQVRNAPFPAALRPGNAA